MNIWKDKLRSIKRKELLRFLVGGGSAVLVDYLLYRVFLRIEIVPTKAKAFSFFCGAVVGFVINKVWTFERHGFAIEEIGRYVLLYSISAGINTMTYQGLCWVLKREGLAFLGATGVSTILNFLGQKFFVFRRGSE